jgi:feruloyl-CoA synthase
MAPFRPLPFKAPDIATRYGADGVIYLSSRTPLGTAPQSMPHLLEERAAQHPDRVWLRQRPPGGGAWRDITYGDGARITRSLAQGLLELGLGPDRPLMILSGNSIEHALIAMAAQRIGAPATPVSMAYSLASSDHSKLKHCVAAVKPGAIFVQTYAPFAKALSNIAVEGATIISADGSAGTLAYSELANNRVSGRVDMLTDALGPSSVAKYLFTSGSTGTPKPTPQTQGALTAQIAGFRALAAWDRIPDPGVLQVLDWMPWSHIAGGNVGFGRCLEYGGTFHIDEGRPAPGLFQITMDNLREVRPQYFGSAPIAYAILADAMEADATLRDAVFSRLMYFLYGGATLSDDLYDRLQSLSVAATGMRTPILTTYGATETQGITMTHWEIERVGMVGLPFPGTTIKLAPSGEKLEVRVKGPSVMPGYLDMPEANAKAFDAEGFYCLGDAARFEDPAHPEKGLVFDGRVTEDFKLSSGTWVSVGTLRPEIVAACAPLVSDAVICGQDKPYIGVLLWPAPAALSAAVTNAGGDRERALSTLREQIEAKITEFNQKQTGSSRRVKTFRLLATPPSLDDGEITDKGYVNQNRAQQVRMGDVEKLFQ